MNMQIDNERFRNVAHLKQFISDKLIHLIKRPPSILLGVCDTEFSSFFRRHSLESSMSFAFESLSHIAHNVVRKVEKKHSLFYPVLRPPVVRFIQTIKLMWLLKTFTAFIMTGCSDVLEAATCQRYV